MARFNDKVALVSGGTCGIGKATALAFAKEGAKVVLAGRRAEEGLAVVEEITSAGGTAHFVCADVTNEADVKRLVEETVAKFGRLDIAFNNAGAEALGEPAEATDADYRRIFDTNVRGVLVSMKHEIPAMRKTGRGGAIINASSVGEHTGVSGASVYLRTKHAVEGLTKAAALECGPQHIRVNAVAPAALATDVIELVGGDGSEGEKELAVRYPIGRLGRAEDVADAVLFLASDAAPFTTGILLPVDGGWPAQ
jgi:NAD(P)-dependent dehydrogenase (short-subunit alcohol dehydrogenase family)